MQKSNHAPYNFVPLSQNVLDPEWASLVSHDLPFADGVSGELSLEIEAETPLLIGGRQSKTKGKPGQVHFFQSPEGYAIPGSSLRGMIRNVFEIATFSKMSNVDDTRFGLRDLSGPKVAQSYRDLFMEKKGKNTGQKMLPRSYGFMSMGPDGGPQITPCEMARLHKDDVSTWLGYGERSFFRAGQTVHQKYQHYREHVGKASKGSWVKLRFDLQPGDRRAIRLGTGKLEGFPVFTGQISNDKKKDFIFYNDDPSKTFSVRERCDRAWRDFLFIHGDHLDDKTMSWPGHWKNVYYNGGKVPVFYFENRKRIRIALAFLPKFASDFSVHDTIRHAGQHHLNDDYTDMAELLFGRVGDKPEKAIKSRVWFEMAELTNDAKPIELSPTILNGPKASYFPNYLEQESVRKDQGQYATYMETSKVRKPKARGWKRYPVREQHELQKVSEDQKKNPDVQVILNPLQKGATFRSRIVFHNIKPVELGALLWAITFGQDEACRHGLGMGKPFGLGRLKVQIATDSFKTMLNNPDSDPVPPSVAEYIALFVEYANTRLRNANYSETSQIRALKAMANPKSMDRKFTGELRHMTMGMGIRNNEFVQAKKAGAVLEGILNETTHQPVYFNAAPELALPSQGETRGLGTGDALIVKLEAALAERIKKNQKTAHGPMIQLREELLSAAQEWESNEQRKRAAEVIRRTVKQQGWPKRRKEELSALLQKLTEDT